MSRSAFPIDDQKRAVNFGRERYSQKMVIETMPLPLAVPAFRTKAWLSFACLTLALAGCAKAPPATSTTRLYAIDQTGAASRCEVKALAVKPDAAISEKMVLSNSGGWCGMTLTQSSGGAFAAGLVERQPVHGKVYIHTVGDTTRADYTPERYYHGMDSFAVKLLPGGGTVTVSVLVNPR